MQPYDDALQEILDHGIKKGDRTGVGCISVAGLQCRYDLSTEAFPIVSKRKMFPMSGIAELLWFISGSTMNQDLEKLGCKFWGKWCDENNPKYRALRDKFRYEPGDFGPIYGWQLRHFGGDYNLYKTAVQDLKRAEEHVDSLDHREHIESAKEDIYLLGGFDQLAWMVNVLKTNPFGSDGRRCLFSLWNPNDYAMQALPPCHYTYQAIADGEGGLTGIMTQRSCDFPVGVPVNIQFYSMLTVMFAQQTGMKAREFIHNTNDSHIYLNQIEKVEEYLSRPEVHSPKLSIRRAVDIFSYTMPDFSLLDYEPGERIDFPVAV